MKKIAFAILGMLALATAALSQSPPFPQTLPPNTVVGRISPVAGPAGAIPISVIQAAIFYGETTVNDANYALVAADRTIAYTAITAARTLTMLPAAAYAPGTRIYLLDRSGNASSTRTISVTPTGADTINGVNGAVTAIVSAFGTTQIESDGLSKWVITPAVTSLAQGGLGASQVPATANQIPVYPGSGGAAVPTSAPSWFDTVYCNTVGQLLVRTISAWTCVQGIPINIEWYGASSGASASTNNTAISNAITAAQNAGSGLLIPGFGYNTSTTFTISSPMAVSCSVPYSSPSNGNFNQTTDVDLWHANAIGVSMRNCYFNGTGTPTSRKGLVVGTDSIAASCSITNGSGSVTCTTSVFTAGMVTNATRIKIVGAGAGGVSLFATITGFTSGTQATVTPNASTTVTNATTQIANVYTDIDIYNTQFNNFNIGIHFINAARFHVTNSRTLSAGTANEGARVESQVSPDFGDSFMTDTQLQSTDNTAGYALHYLSSGGLKIKGGKMLGGKYAVFLDWNVGTSGQLEMGGGTSIESCGTSAIFVTAAVQFNGIDLDHVNVDCGSPNIVVDNASPAVINGVNFTGVTCQGGGGTCISLGKVNFAHVQATLVNNGAVSPGIAVLSNCTSCYVGNNHMPGATLTYTNAGTGTTMIDQEGTTFANLPTGLANGSEIFCTNCAPASSPCTGASTGAKAVKQNGAFKCF